MVAVGGGRVVRKVDKDCERLQTSSYEMNKFWRSKHSVVTIVNNTVYILESHLGALKIPNTKKKYVR